MSFFVYRFFNKHSGKSYIGQTTVSILRRKSVHLSKLKNKIHNSAQMQDDYSKYGPDVFYVYKLEEVFSQSDLDACEQKWIENYKTYLPENGYNKERGGKIFKLGNIQSSLKGKRLSESHKAALKKSKAGKSYSEVAYRNVKKTPVVAENVRTGEKKNFNTLRECAEFLNVSNSCVRCHIVRKTGPIKSTWKINPLLGGSY